MLHTENGSQCSQFQSVVLMFLKLMFTEVLSAPVHHEHSDSAVPSKTCKNIFRFLAMSAFTLSTCISSRSAQGEGKELEGVDWK
jgi:hypothetical protein